ncbi:MAG: selenoneine synthase SenA [Ramlibacter sp.]
MNDPWLGYSAAQALRTGGRQIVREALLALRGRTLRSADAYAAALGGADMRVPRWPTLNLPLWELGHVAWFQEWWIGRNRQRLRGAACDPDHARAASLLPGADAFYDSTRVAHATRWDLALPDAAATRAYLDATFQQTLQVLDALGDAPGDDELYFFRWVALHEAMHVEAAAYMARELGIALPDEVAAGPAPNATVLHVPARTFRIGWTGAGFAFDNELSAHDVQLDAFDIDASPVDRARFLEFERAGGYEKQRWWDDDGWAWLQTAGRPEREHSAGVATHLNAHEASAWCRWAGRRLPTEVEWECAALTQPQFTWGQAWEWTATTFRPYPGFVPHPYRDYSAPWFETRRVLRGACPATSHWLAHPRYRNFFEPDRRDIFAGFRSCA